MPVRLSQALYALTGKKSDVFIGFAIAVLLLAAMPAATRAAPPGSITTVAAISGYGSGSSNPANGGVGGFTRITITGTGVDWTSANVTSVWINASSTPCTNVSVGANGGAGTTVITCTTPAYHTSISGATVVSVGVVEASGTLTLANGFQYNPQFASTIVNTTAGNQGYGTANGGVGGGNTVTVSGGYFTVDPTATTSSMAVRFSASNSYLASNVVVLNDTTITCTTPGHSSGTVAVGPYIATNSGGSHTSASTMVNFTYVNPTVTAVSPLNSGTIVQGSTTNSTLVTLTGSYFSAPTGGSSNTMAMSGSVTVSNFTIVNDSTITFTAGTHTATSSENIEYTIGWNNGSGASTAGNITIATMNFAAVTSPTVQVVPAGGITTSNSPITTSSSPITFAITFSSSVTGLAANSTCFTVTNGTLGTLTGSGASYSITVTPSAAGVVTLKVNAGAAGGNFASNVSSVTYFAPPTVQFAVGSETVSQSAGTYSITVNLSAAAVAAVSVPFTMSGTAVNNLDYNPNNGTPLVIPAGSSSGTLTGTLLSHPGVNTTLTYTLGTPTNATLASSPAFTANTLTITQGGGGVTPSPASLPAGSVGVAYSQTITVSSGTMALGTVTGSTGLESGVTGGGTATITISGTPTAAGTLSFSVTPSGGSAVPYSATINAAAAPTVTVSPTGTNTTSAPITFTMTFSQSVTGFTTSGITVTNGTLGTLSGSGTTYTIPVTPIGAGAVTLQVKANAAGGNTASNTASVTLAPSVAVSPTGTSSSSSPITFTMTFSESVTGLTAAGLTVGNGTLGALSGSGTTWTIPVTPAAAGAVTLAVNASAAQDVYGNNNTASTTASVTYSAGAPTLTSYAVNGSASASTATVGVNGGYTVTINGSGFTGINTSTLSNVQFNGSNALAITFVNDGQITAVTPTFTANHSGQSIVVKAPGGTATGTGVLNITVPTFAPATQPNSIGGGGGYSVTITGNYLTGFSAGGNTAFTPTIMFDSWGPATIVGTPTDTSITVNSPVITSNTSSNISLTYNGGSSVNFTGFTTNKPTVTSVSPTTLPPGGGSVVITGTYLLGATAVTFGGTNATSFTVNNAGQITAVAPALGPGAQAIAVTAGVASGNTGVSITYLGPPTVTGIATNTSGPVTGGTSVTINGTNFNGTGGTSAVTGVSFGNTACTTYTVAANGLSITATSPSCTLGAGSVHVTVTTNLGTSATNGNDHFSYQPVITSIVNPLVSQGSASASLPWNTGSIFGLYPVTLNGAGFTGATAVSLFGSTGVPAQTLVVSSDTQMTFVPPGQSYTPSGYVLVTAKGTLNGQIGAAQSSTTATGNTTTAGGGTGNQFAYVLPSITGVSPNSGPVAGGQQVTVTGQYFTGVTAVEFGGGAAATGITATSDTTITCTTPPGYGAEATTITVYVNAEPGAASGNIYTWLGPTITSFTPTSGPSLGGTSVTISGTSLNGATAVVLGGTSYSSSALTGWVLNTAASPQTLTFNTPAHAAGAVNVQVSVAGNSTINSAVAAQGSFTFIAPPAITSVTPNTGPVAGRTVALTGTAFANASTVSVGGVNTTFTPPTSSTSITGVVIPPGTVGAVSITVTTPDGTSPPVSFTYTPVITSHTYPEATNSATLTVSVGGGTQVTINGSGFTGVATSTTPSAAVTFGGLAAASILSVTDTQIVAFTPTATAAAAGKSVVVTVNGVSSPANTSLTFSPPVVTTVSPSTVDIGGGATVTVTGQYFTGINTNALSSVTLAGVSAAKITFVSDTQLIAVTAPTSAAVTGVVQVTIASSNGTWPGFSYKGGSIGSISPGSGPITGGTAVTVTGVGFTGATAVNFGSAVLTPATSSPPTSPGTFWVNSDTSITAISPPGAAGPVNVSVTAGGVGSTYAIADQFTYYLYFNYNWTTWQSLNWSTPAGSTITWNAQSLPVQVSVNNAFFSWYAPSTQHGVHPADGSLFGMAWGAPTATNIAGTGGMQGPFYGVGPAGDPAGNGGSIVTGDWKDFVTGKLSYYGTYSNANAWNNPVFWSYYNAAFQGTTYSVVATTTTITNNAGYQYFLTSDGLANSPLGRTNYVGNSGMYYFNTDPSNPGNAKYSNGPLFQDSRTNLSGIPDGTSNTLLFGESLGGPDNALPTYQLTWMGTGTMPSYWDCQSPSQYFMFSSMHPGVVNFAFCDGSVRSVSKVTASVPADAMGTLATANPGDGTNVNNDTARPPAASNPATARWIAFQLLAGISDNATPDMLQLGLTP